MSEAREFASDVGMPFLETSAKEAVNVEAAFLTMVHSILSRVSQQPLHETSYLHEPQVRRRGRKHKDCC
jgi:Ras-related protein Rab-1A